jgi:CheY-like chemotaxis protein
MDGFAFMHEFRKHPEWRHIPVIVVTARELSDADRRELDGGVKGILQKGGGTLEDIVSELKGLAKQI